MAAIIAQRIWAATYRSAIFTDILSLLARVLAIEDGKRRSIDSGGRSRRQCCWVCPWYRVGATAVSGRCYAAAFIDGHVSQDADRLASTRARRATAARVARSASTASPVP